MKGLVSFHRRLACRAKYFGLCVLFFLGSGVRMLIAQDRGNTTAQEYGDPVYRVLDPIAGFLNYNYNHTGIFSGLNSGNYERVRQALGASTTTAEVSFSAQFTNYEGTTSNYYGAYTLDNRTMSFVDRKNVVKIAADLVNAAIPYPSTFFQAPVALEYYGSNFDGTVEDISNIRCDGFVEYCYEKNGFRVWRNQSYADNTWSIVSYPDYHNDRPDATRNPEREASPWAQRGAPCATGPTWNLGCSYSSSDTKMNSAAVINLPTYQVTQVAGNGYVDVTVRATDESGIHYIKYKKPGDADWSYSPTQVQDPTSDSYSYTVRVTSSGTFYTFAMDNGGNYPSNAAGYQITVVSTPATPSNLIALANGSTVNLTWSDNSSNEDGFKIERKTGDSGIYSEIASVGAGIQNYTNIGVSTNQVYYYKVRAYKGLVYSGYSNEYYATTMTAPSSLAASAASSSQINLTWTDNPIGENGFKIERKTGAGGSYSSIADVPAGSTSYWNTGLSASTSYYYRVRSYANSTTTTPHYSAFSNEAVATTPITPINCYSLTTGNNPNGSGTVSITTSQNCSGGYTSGTPIGLQATPNDGYTFNGWTGSGGTFANPSSLTTTFTISNIATVTANFTSAPPTQGLPYVEAGDPANVTCSSAQLNGTVNPNGLSTTAWIVCSQSPDLVNPITTPSQTIGSGTSAVPFTQTVTGLSPGTQYFCRIFADNSAGERSGSQKSFTTTVCGAPTVETKPATSITPFSAQLNGTIKSNAGDTRFYYEWGTSTSYGYKTPESGPQYWAEATPIPQSAYNLNPNTTYHFRLVARNSAGTTYGNDLTFTTLAKPPAVTTTTATNIIHDSAQLNGSVNPNGASTTYYFEYGTTANFGSKTNNAYAGSGTSAISVNSEITGLSPNTTYHFRLVATNNGGTNSGNDLTFTTLAIPLPATAAYGKIPKGDQAHADDVKYSFSGRSGHVYLSYQAYDVDTRNEVIFKLNGTKILNVPTTTDNKWSSERGVLLKDGLVNDSGDNVVVFNNTLNPPQARNWGVRQVSVENCLPLPAIAAYGKFSDDDQKHADKVVYCFWGQPGDLNLTYDVYDIDNEYELDILLNGVKIYDETVTANNKWSSKRACLLPDSLVKDSNTNVLVFNNTKNLNNMGTWVWGVRKVDVAPTTASAIVVGLFQSLDISGKKIKNSHSLFDGQIGILERPDDNEELTTTEEFAAIAPDGYLMISFPTTQRLDYLLLYPEDNPQRFFIYRIEASLDGQKWHMLVDKTNSLVQGVQLDQIPNTQARFLRISGASYLCHLEKLENQALSEETYRQAFEEIIRQSKPTELTIAELMLFQQEPLVTTETEKTTPPAEFRLSQNFPNPFNPATTIRFATPSAGKVKVTVYNIHGELVRTLMDGEVAAGDHEVSFDASNLATGIYFYRLEAGGFTATQKMILAK